MKKLTIGEIEAKLESSTEDLSEFIRALQADERKGVQQLLKKRLQKRQQLEQGRIKREEMTKFEMLYRQQGFSHIAGIDEVGRGPLAGPVIAAAVILPEGYYLEGIDDSKKLTEKKREELFDIIIADAISVGIGVISAAEIDVVNIYEATKKAMYEAILQLPVQPDFLLIDAMKLSTHYPFEAIIKGDSKSVSIAAASIVAKVTRDRLMKEMALQYPEYKFEQNMGYGTKDHIEALNTYGATPIHRTTFAPVKELIKS